MKKRIILFFIVIVLLLGCYIYYKKNNTYEEFEIVYQDNEQLNDEKGEEEIDKSEQQTQNNEIILVHITGEVKSCGVVELKEGSRIIDAVNKAGGFTKNADTSKVNLAYVLSDGVKIYIPNKNENANTKEKEYITMDSGDNVITEEKEMENKKELLVNINEATQTELETLPGIGPSTALKIISYREEKGNFSSIEDIKNVSGIGENKFESIKDLICI